MSRNAYFFLLFVLLLVACFAYQEEGTRLPQSGVEEENRYSGGENFTSFDFGENAFGGQGDGLSREESRFFASGNNLFRTNWVVAPASVESLDGVGPLFNANSCGSCHFKDGRAAPFDVLKKGRLGILWRLSIPGIGLHGAPRKHPVYGGQIQDQSIPQATPEAQVRTTYQSIAGQYADGTPYTLQKPIYELTDLAYGPLDEALMLSPRVAPHVAGLGLLESISEADLLQHADPDDRDGDGISGRANRVWNIVEQQVTMGRFGWKANEPTVRQQNAGAFNGDMGLTSNLFPKDEFSPQQDRRHPGIPNGGQPEVSDQQLDRITLYVKALAVPAKRNTADPQFAEGKALFAQLQCNGCHVPSFTTGTGSELASLDGQEIFPYTDLLLHDMGEDLSDGRPDFLATGREWRTPPLWGIGLIRVVNDHTRFLHDGRARNLEEAILWHGGEAEASRESFKTLTKAEREALLFFLESI